MGCDIHPFLEVRTVLDYNRNDGEIQALKRAVTEGDQDALSRLNSYEVLSPWTFAAGFKYLYGGEEQVRLEFDEDDHLGIKWALETERMWNELPRENRRKESWREAYSIHPDLHPLSRNRNYYLFAWMTGTVRNWGDRNRVRGITEDTKGMPVNTSPFVMGEYEFEGADAHSASWLTAREVLEAPEALVDGQPSKRARDAAETLREFMFGWGRTYGIDRVRLVFWFDN